jgi:hypothetical protein
MDRHDALTLFGLTLLAAGLALYSPPLALVVVGVLLMALGIYGATR